MISSDVLVGLHDELEKIAVSPGLLRRAADKSVRKAGKMTTQAQKFHRAAWKKDQALKAKLAPRLKAYKASQGRSALKPKKPGFFSRLMRGSPQPAHAGA